MGKPDVPDQARQAHRLEEVQVVRGHRAVGAEADGHTPVQHLAHRRDAAPEPEIARGVVSDRAPGVGETPDVVVGEPHPVSTDEPRTEERSEEHTSELQSLAYLVCRLLLEKKNTLPRIGTSMHTGSIFIINRFSFAHNRSSKRCSDVQLMRRTASVIAACFTGPGLNASAMLSH